MEEIQGNIFSRNNLSETMAPNRDEFVTYRDIRRIEVSTTLSGRFFPNQTVYDASTEAHRGREGSLP